MKMVPKRFRTKQAIGAFEKCLECTNVPETQRVGVESLLAEARARLQKQEDEAPPPENCQIQ